MATTDVWRDYIKMLDRLFHIPIDGLDTMLESHKKIMETLLGQLKAQNEALRKCYESTGGEAPPSNVTVILNSSKVLLDGMGEQVEQMGEFASNATDSLKSLTSLQIDIGDRFAEFIPKMPPKQTEKETQAG